MFPLKLLKRDEIPSGPYGVVGIFDTPAEIYHACEQVRDAGYKKFDALTPFPVHGLERAMGLKPSIMPWVVLAGGASGLSFMIWLAWYTQAVLYPQNIGGKAAFSYQAYVPLFFELTVLFSALFAFFGLWIVNKLPQFFHPVMQHPSFPRVTDDKFMIVIESADGKFGDGSDAKALLGKAGAKEIQEVGW
jgi:hypothetical protein